MIIVSSDLFIEPCPACLECPFGRGCKTKGVHGSILAAYEEKLLIRGRHDACVERLFAEFLDTVCFKEGDHYYCAWDIAIDSFFPVMTNTQLRRYQH